MKQESKIGSRMRVFREERGLSLEELADTTSLDIRFLAALENGETGTPLGPLLKISRALGQRLGTFMDDEACKDPVITTAGHYSVDLSMQKVGNKHPNFEYHSLAKGKADRNMEPFLIEIAPDTEEQTMSSHQGEEFIQVQAGRLQVIYGREEHLLEVGDTIYYNSIVPHYVGAYGEKTVTILAVVYYP